MRLAFVVLGLLLLPSSVRAQGPLHWTAQQIAGLEKKIAGAVDPVRHLGAERFLDGATLIHRDGPSEAEVHQKLADFITVRAGEGEMLVGGTMVDGRVSAPDELRGPSMNGGPR